MLPASRTSAWPTVSSVAAVRGNTSAGSKILFAVSLRHSHRGHGEGLVKVTDAASLLILSAIRKNSTIDSCCTWPGDIPRDLSHLMHESG